MDLFGIGSAIKGAVNIYFRSARQSGRTTGLIETVQSGDRIVFSCPKEAERVRRLCLEKDKQVICTVRKSWGALPPIKGRTYFDHGWVEETYLNNIDRIEKDIEDLERSCNRHLSQYPKSNIGKVLTKLNSASADRWR